jgi:asparagine synthase (glutamine-hydrolysing)
MARQHVTVALSGDGGDELLGGYGRYQIQQRIARVFEGPFGPFAAHLLAPVLQLWPQSLSGRGIAELFVDDRQTRYERAMSDPWLLQQTTVAGASQFSFPSVWDKDEPSLLAQMRGADVRLYLPEDLMTKVDRTSMRFGLEVRAPLLDRGLFDVVGKAPKDLLHGDGHAKHPFRRALEQELDPILVNRPKHGFSVPLNRWFRHELRQMAADTLTSRQAFVPTVVSLRVVKDLLAEHVRGTRNHADRIWRLLSLELWHQHHSNGSP